MTSYKMTAIVTIILIIGCIIIGYNCTKTVMTETYTEISAETLSKMFTEDFENSQQLIGNYYIIDGTVDDTITFQKENIVLLNGGLYSPIYVKNAIRQKGNRVQIKCKLTEYAGALFATAK